MAEAAEITAFWFGENEGVFRPIWFNPDDAFREATRRFQEDYQRAADGELNEWRATPESSLALILLLDQFPNLLFQGDARAFATDEQAREVTKEALAKEFDKQFSDIHQWFFYLPLEHSENLEDQQRAVELFGQLEQNETNAMGLDFARRHLRVIERFGRFPNRNAALGRANTPEETEFLAGPDAPF